MKGYIFLFLFHYKYIHDIVAESPACPRRMSPCTCDDAFLRALRAKHAAVFRNFSRGTRCTLGIRVQIARNVRTKIFRVIEVTVREKYQRQQRNSLCPLSAARVCRSSAFTPSLRFAIFLPIPQFHSRTLWRSSGLIITR